MCLIITGYFGTDEWRMLFPYFNRRTAGREADTDASCGGGHVLALAPQDLITLDSIGSTQFCISNNRGIGTYTFAGTYTPKGIF